MRSLSQVGRQNNDLGEKRRVRNFDVLPMYLIARPSPTRRAGPNRFSPQSLSYPTTVDVDREFNRCTILASNRLRVRLSRAIIDNGVHCIMDIFTV